MGDLGDEWTTQPVGDRCPENGSVGVGRLLPEEDEIGLLALEGASQHVARRDQIGARSGIVGDEHGPVSTHRECLAERIDRLRGPERDHHDLASVRLFESESLLHRVHVGCVEGTLARPVEPVRRGVDPPHRGRIGNLLDANGDLHNTSLEEPSGRVARFEREPDHGDLRVAHPG